jgi:hypothetical protein
MADDRVRVVTIMNYPPEDRNAARMGYAFLDSVVRAGASSVTILTEDHPPAVAPEHRAAADIEVVRGKSIDVGYPHFNLRFKLPNLAAQREPFLFLDADTYILGDLRTIWPRRLEKPWIGVDHQWVPADGRTHRAAFLNSGVQLVGDPAFYNLDAILAVQNAAAPLRDADPTPGEHPGTFLCCGRDQAVLFRYFVTTGYDYTHPAVGPAWNSCAGLSTVRRDGDRWIARTHGQLRDHDVMVRHYWDQFKPWRIGCPIFESYAGRGPG